MDSILGAFTESAVKLSGVKTFLTFSDSRVGKPVHSTRRQFNFDVAYRMLAKAALLPRSMNQMGCLKFSLRTKKKEIKLILIKILLT